MNYKRLPPDHCSARSLMCPPMNVPNRVTVTGYKHSKQRSPFDLNIEINKLDELVKTYGKSHVLLVDQHISIALHHQHITGEFNEALRHSSNALHILESMIVENDCNIHDKQITNSSKMNVNQNNLGIQKGVIKIDIGDVLMKMNKEKEALRSYEEAIRAFRINGIGDDHHQMLSAQRKLALCSRKLFTPADI